MTMEDSSSLIRDMEYLNSSDSDFWFAKYIGDGSLQGVGYNPWVGSLLGAVIVGLSGVFPLLVIPLDGGLNFNKGASAEKLKVLLSFAVGGLLGDVFLHLLPEAWNYQQQLAVHNGPESHPSMHCGLWVLTGLLVFTILEKVFSVKEAPEEEEPVTNNNLPVVSSKPKQMSGYLNLMANVIDNFTHGLAVGGSFVLSARVGVLTTLAILVHEVPHEVGDFAILLRAGFSRVDAARAQLLTASSSLLGAAVAVTFSGASDLIEARTSWILPFTAGGFLHIALVIVLPELLQEKDLKESLKQMASLVLGISLMAAMTAIVE